MMRREPLQPAWIRKRPRLSRLHRFFTIGVWRLDRTSLGPVRAFFVRWLRVVLLTGRNFERDECLMRAAALTYVTVFSMVPLLAFGFAMAKGFGADEFLQERVIAPFLDQTFPAPTAEEGEDSAAGRLRDATDKVFVLVESTDLKGLGAFGLAFLLYSVVKLLGAVERTMNEIWGVKNTRSLTRRVSNYVALVVMTPIVLITGAGIAAVFQRGGRVLAPDGTPLAGLNEGLLHLVPFVMVWAGMSYLYLVLPNTRVRLVSAVLGGVVAGTLWQFAQILHVQLQVGMARFNAIYASFAVLPIFLLWIYVNWTTLLLGVQVTFAHQNEARYADIARTGPLDQSLLEALALRLAGRAVRAFLKGGAAPTEAELAGQLGVSPRVVSQVLERLSEGDVLVRTDEDHEGGYLPARSPDDLRVADVLHALRHQREESTSLPVDDPLDRRAERIVTGLEADLRSAHRNPTLRELALGEEPAVDDPEVVPLERAAGLPRLPKGPA